MEEKKTILERIQNPPALTSAQKRGKRGKKQRRPRSAKGGLLESEKTPLAYLPQENELLPYLPTPNEILRQREGEGFALVTTTWVVHLVVSVADDYRQKARMLLFTRCETTEVNLRKYRILGGVFHVDLINQPPQPKDLGQEVSLTTREFSSSKSETGCR